MWLDGDENNTETDDGSHDNHNWVQVWVLMKQGSLEDKVVDVVVSRWTKQHFELFRLFIAI